MHVIIFGSIGTGQPVCEIPETRKQVKQNNCKKYSSNSNIILMAAKLGQYRHPCHELDHRQCWALLWTARELLQMPFFVSAHEKKHVRIGKKQEGDIAKVVGDLSNSPKRWIICKSQFSLVKGFKRFEYHLLQVPQTNTILLLGSFWHKNSKRLKITA